MATQIDVSFKNLEVVPSILIRIKKKKNFQVPNPAQYVGVDAKLTQPRVVENPKNKPS